MASLKYVARTGRDNEEGQPDILYVWGDDRGPG
jgi:hypothetical protein